ncbi:MAG TPA: hypothetical protein VLA16_16895 [Ideonella sp.]|nr:hypothetical protein [Ideonella sp.]
MNPLFGPHLAPPSSSSAVADARQAAGSGAPWQAGRWWDGLDAPSGSMIVAELSLGGTGLSATEHAQRVLAHLLDDSSQP